MPMSVSDAYFFWKWSAVEVFAGKIRTVMPNLKREKFTF